MIYRFLTLLLIFFYSSIYAQKIPFHGEVIDQNNAPIPLALIIISDSIKTQTNLDGHFHINLEPRNYTVKITMLGFKDKETNINLIPNAGEFNFVLKEDLFNMNEVVVTATRDYVKKQNTPIIVNITDDQTFNAVQAVSLSEGIAYQPGLRLETNCQNCGFTQLRINGLQGPYSQILINGKPVFSALNGVYGLEQIPTAMIDRVEVVKGGGSALYGSNAIAGTVNIITKKPEEDFFQLKSNSAIIDGQSWDNSLQMNGAVVNPEQTSGASFFGIIRERSPYDANGDGFSEMTKIHNLSLGTNLFYKPTEKSELNLDIYGISEERRGGNLFDKPPHETDITEWLDHKIIGAQLGYELLSENQKNRYSVYVSGQKTVRNSYYGGGGNVAIPTLDNNSTAADSIAVLQAFTDREISLKGYGLTNDYTFVAGFQFTHHIDSLFGRKASFVSGVENKNNNTVDEITGYNRLTDQQVNNLGVYTQLSFMPFKKTTLLLGLRYDYNFIEGNYRLGTTYSEQNSIHLNVLSPRVNIMQDIGKNLKFRVGYARGFRTPQAFDEDLHLAIVGGDIQFIVLDGDLNPEISHAFTSSLSYTTDFGKMQAMFTADAFYTVLNHAFVNEALAQQPSDEYKLMVKRNSNGAFVRGVNLEAALATSRNVKLQMGSTLQQALYNEEEIIWSAKNNAQADVTTKQMLRSPNIYGYFTAIYTYRKFWDIALTGIYTGPMKAAHIVDPQTQYTVIETTPSFFEGNIKLSRKLPFKNNLEMEISAGVQNIFNSYQSDFDTGANRDANYIYGPGRPRTFFVGLKIGNSL